MAIDSRAKRSNVVGLSPWSATLPPSDGSINLADRQALAFTYRGIAAASGILTAYPDPFAATSLATINPFAATSRYKGP
jgi:hypothetical protein